MLGDKPLVGSAEAGATEAEAQTVLLRPQLAGEEASSITVLGAQELWAHQLREVFRLAESLLGLVERSQEGGIVSQQSLQVGWPGGGGGAGEGPVGGRYISYGDVIYKLADTQARAPGLSLLHYSWE